MDPDGNIQDMQGNFIGTANANELEEMGDLRTEAEKKRIDKQTLKVVKRSDIYLFWNL